MRYFLSASVFGILFGFAALQAGGGVHYPLTTMVTDSADKPSLQRGAKYYMNYCSSCHSLKYTRYGSVAKYIGVMDENAQIDKDLFSKSLIFVDAALNEPIVSSLSPEDARNWFGIEPPDLTLVTRVRGVDWVYTYLKSFYQDSERPWGVNNAVFPDVGMPNVLLSLQGEQVAVKDPQGHVKYLRQGYQGQMSEHQFDLAVRDIVNFLNLVAEPAKAERLQLGPFVILFLLLLLPLLYAIKRLYWKEI